MAQTLTSPATAPRHSGHLSAGTRPEPEAARALAPTVPAALGNCANAKKMPNRQTGADSCTGGRFTPHRVVMGCSMRRAVATGNSVAPACSETRCEKRGRVREGGPEAVRQSRPGWAAAWWRTPEPDPLLTRHVSRSAECERA